jgi:dCTP deaminase
MVLSDRDIVDRCAGETPMIDPFVPHQVRQHDTGARCISYGLSSYGYDIRLGNHVRLARNPAHMVGGDALTRWCIDPKDDLTEHFEDEPVVASAEGRYIKIPPHGFALAHSLERFCIPRDIVAICFGKSTYARCGLIVNVTPLEPEWQGWLTLEISNTTPMPARVYVGEGICQIVFHTALRTCLTSYADRRGKYDNQPAEPVLPRA